MPASAELRGIVERFVAGAEEPAVLDPGEQPLALTAGQWSLAEWNGRLTFQAWDAERNLVRRISALKEQCRNSITLRTERFPKTEGELQIADLAAPLGLELRRRTTRAAFRERFQLMLARQFPDWRLENLTVETNLEHSLSGVYARAFLRQGSYGMAAIGAPPEMPDCAGVLSFGLVWLDYLRRRELRCMIRVLNIHAPVTRLTDVAARAQWLNPAVVDVRLYGYDERDRAGVIDVADAGNITSSLPVCYRPVEPNGVTEVVANLPPGVTQVLRSDGTTGLQVLGLEFAHVGPSGLFCGISRRTRASASTAAALAAEISRVRNPAAADFHHPLYSAKAEGWLEALVRANPGSLDASLRQVPVYGQVPVFDGGDRGVIDLLAIDQAGQLVVIELKAAADIHLPFQALDYWMRVRRHLLADDFERQGYFAGHTISRVAPRILLVAPALEYHSTTEVILGALNTEVRITRLGLAADWRRELRVMFRLNGCESPGGESVQSAS